MGAVDLHPNLGRETVEALSRAVHAVQRACRQTRTWRHGADDMYVVAGHNAVVAIDDTLTALHTARAALVGELWLDDHTRAEAQIGAMSAGHSTQDGAPL